MKTQMVSEEVATLYNKLRDCIRANNKDQAKRVYRELAQAGRPLSEILGEARSVSEASGTTTNSVTEEDYAPLEEWPHQKTFAELLRRMPDPIPRTSHPPQQSAEPTIGSYFTTVGLQPQRDKASPEERPATPSLEVTPSDPGYQSLEAAISSDPGGASATDSEPERNNPPLDETTPRSAATALERSTSDVAPQISTRAISSGIDLDPSPSSIDAAVPARRGPSARLAVALVTIIAIASVGWFLLPRRAVEQVAGKTAPPSEVVITAAGEKGLTSTAPAGQPAAAAVARTNSTERTPEIAAATPTPVPVAPSPAAAAAAPGDLFALKPDATPVVAKLEMPEGASPSVSALPEAPPPATVPTAVSPTTVLSPSEPHASTAETAALLARGDSLFGVGDVASARLFYERAAYAGDGQAALRLGETYDPNFLERTRVRAVLGDLAAAVFWYRRARDLGVAEAEILTGAIMAGYPPAATTTEPSPDSARANLTTAPDAPVTGAASIVTDRPSAIRPGAEPSSVDPEQIRRHARYGNRSHYSDHRSGAPSDHMARQLNANESGRPMGWRGGLYNAPRDSPNNE